MMRRGRPGLIGTVARTAVIAGTATAVTKGVSNKMNDKEAAKQQAAADQQQQAADAQAPAAQPADAQPATPAPAEDDLVAQLQKLSDLKNAGVLSDEEFTAAKSKLIGV